MATANPVSSTGNNHPLGAVKAPDHHARTTMPTAIEAIDIHVTSRHSLDEQLEAAVKDLQEAAMLTGTYGILVTRNKPGRYTAALSDQVPFGMTRELVH